MLPLELAFEILEKLFLGTGHAGLCALRNLSLASHSTFQTVSVYLQCKIPFEYLHNVQWVPFPDKDEDVEAADLEIEILPLDDSLETCPDIITSTVLDDCPQCFDWLCKEFPSLNPKCCNRHGWSFAAIVAHAGSARLLKHFLTKTNGAYGTFFPLMTAEANPFAAESDTPWRILVNQCDLAKFERCLLVIELVLVKANKYGLGRIRRQRRKRNV